jgi:hypothetical protein
MKFKAQISTDRTACTIEIPATASILRADELEELINNLGAFRGGMLPEAGQLRSPLEDDLPSIDCTSPPHLDLAVVAGSQPLVLLAIAFRQIGWRTLALSPREAAELGRKLLALSAGQQLH